MSFNITIETVEGVKPHGFHLGTELPIAESFIYERLRNGAISVALYDGSALPGFGGRLVHIYDWRDLPENGDEPELFGWANPALEDDA